MNIYKDIDKKEIEKHLDIIYKDLDNIFKSWEEKNLHSTVYITMIFEIIFVKLIKSFDTKEIFSILSIALDHSVQLYEKHKEF